MPSLLIDVTRLLYRRMTGRLPTGIDRVGLEYIRHFGTARALLSWRGLSATLSRADSARMFELLLRPGTDVAATGWSLIAKACAFGWLPAGVGDGFLCNTGHYGLDHRGYAALPRLFGARQRVGSHVQFDGRMFGGARRPGRGNRLARVAHFLHRRAGACG